jgi:hypothetical protein
VSPPQATPGAARWAIVGTMTTCESCGRDEREVILVQRVYLLPEADPAQATPEALAASATPTAGDIERWCASCCATFPHTVVDTD